MVGAPIPEENVKSGSPGPFCILASMSVDRTTVPGTTHTPCLSMKSAVKLNLLRGVSFVSLTSFSYCSTSSMYFITDNKPYGNMIITHFQSNKRVVLQTLLCT